MNKTIQKLFTEACYHGQFEPETVPDEVVEKFTELIVEECRTVVNELYHKTPLELCGPLLTADEEIAKHFYGVE